MTAPLVIYLAPLLLILCAGLGALRPGRRPGPIAQIAEGAGLAAMVIALVAIGLLIMHRPSTAPLLPGFSIRLDVISVVMLCLVSFVGWVVLRYARSYVDGEARQGAFMGWMPFFVASLLFLKGMLYK